MKQNWWKLLVVAVLAVAVVGVVATKNKGTDKPQTAVTEETTPTALAEKPAVETAQAEPSEAEKPEVSEQNTKVEESQSPTAAPPVVEKPKEKPKANDAVVKPVVQKPAATVVKTEQPEPKAEPIAEPAKKPEKAKQLPKLIDLGANKCMSCKMMTPVLEALSKEYKGKLEVVFIDVWENREASEDYGIQSIPTQIFYDAKGKEFFRHTGFYSKDEILAKFKEQGINLRKE